MQFEESVIHFMFTDSFDRQLLVGFPRDGGQVVAYRVWVVTVSPCTESSHHSDIIIVLNLFVV